MTVEDSTLTATTGESIAIYAKESSLTIDNSTVTAQATADDSNVAIWCDEDLTITNDGNLTAHSGGSYGLYVTSGKASIADSLVSVTGKNGIRVIEGDLELSGATGSLTANSYALLADAGDISIAGNSTLTLEGNNGVVLVSGAGATLGFGGTTWYQWSSQKDGLSTPSIETPYAYDPTDTYLRIEPIGATYTLEVNGVKQGEYAAGANVTISADSYTDDQHFSGWTLVSGAGVSLSGASSTTSFTMPASDVSLKVTYESHVLESHAAKPPTCTEAGWEAYQTCECGYATGPVSVPATGHTYLNGVCTACGAAQPRPSRPIYPPPRSPRRKAAASTSRRAGRTGATT